MVFVFAFNIIIFMGRANRGARGGGALRESASGGVAGAAVGEITAFEPDISRMENALGSNLDDLRKAIGSKDFNRYDVSGGYYDISKGYYDISKRAISNYSGVFERAVSEILRKGDMEKLAEVMETVDPNFEKEKFLREVNNGWDGGKFRGATEEDFQKAVAAELEERIEKDLNLEKIAETEGVEESDIRDAILTNPYNNRFLEPYIEKDLWIRETNIAQISDSWRRAGGSADLLSGNMRPVETVAASAGLLNHSDAWSEDVTSYTDEGSVRYFIEENPITSSAPLIYGDRRSYNIVVDDENQKVEVQEVRNEDGQALKIGCQDIKVSIVRAANLNSNGERVSYYDTGDGPETITQDHIDAYGSLENLGVSLIRKNLRSRKQPDSQAERLFDELSSI